MATLFTLTFQGEVKIIGSASADEEREVARQAFPLSLPRDAAVREGFRAWKLAPLVSARLLVSVVANRGDVDSYKRPVLRARGCLLSEQELTGPARDLGAVWSALENEDAEDSAALMDHIESLSAQTSLEAFTAIRTELGRSEQFFAHLAGALGLEQVDLYFGRPEDAPRLLRPALALLPLARLKNLHLAIGTEVSEYREPILGLSGSAPEAPEKGFLGGFFGKDKEEESVVADFQSREVRGHRVEGPNSLVEAVVNDRPWPDGLQGIERYRVLLECLDAAELGKPQSLFTARPELQELRQAIHRLEELDEELKQWQ